MTEADFLMNMEEKKENQITGTLAFIIGYFSISVRASAYWKPDFISHLVGASDL